MEEEEDEGQSREEKGMGRRLQKKKLAYVVCARTKHAKYVKDPGGDRRIKGEIKVKQNGRSS